MLTLAISAALAAGRGGISTIRVNELQAFRDIFPGFA
jgi:hypothetical protein